MLLVDAGDFAADPEPGESFFTDGLVEGMGRLGYAAAALGGRELAGGDALAGSLRSNPRLPVLAANLPEEERRRWGAKPLTVLEAGGIRVGLFGMTGKLKTDFRPGFRPLLEPAPPEGAPPLLDYAETVERTVAALRERADVVVLLAQADLGKATELLREFPGIDVLVSSMPAYFGREPIEVGPSVMVFSGEQGQRAGRLRLKVYSDGTVGVVSGELVRLGEAIEEDPEIAALVAATTARANDWHRARAEEGLRAGADPAAGAAPYATAAACRDCHEPAWEAWRASAHARAMAPLERGRQDFLPRCVSCHVTGMGEAGGFRDRLSTPELVEVQCEACHGPAAAHVADPEQPLERVGLASCAETCHTPEQTAGPFDAAGAWEAIRH